MNYHEFLNKYQKKEVIVHQDISEQQPVVSVCVQTYQHVNYIKQCLDGILMQQTNFPIEILLGEDASTDGTREICLEYASKHPDKIRLFLHHRDNNIAINGTPTGRFNFLYNLYNARGKYIALCEGDDYWTDPLKLQKQVDFLEGNKEYALIFTNGNVIYSDKSKKEHAFYKNDKNPAGYYNSFEIPKKNTDIYKLANGNYIHTPGVLFRNAFQNNSLPEYMSEVTIGDWPLYMYLASTGNFFFLNEFTFNYRVHQKGVYSNKTVLNKYQMTLGQFPGMIDFKGFKERVIQEIKKYCIRSAKVYLSYCTKKKDLKFLNDFLNSIRGKDELFYGELIHTLNNQSSKIRIKKGNLVFTKHLNLKNKIKSFLKKVFR